MCTICQSLRPAATPEFDLHVSALASVDDGVSVQAVIESEAPVSNSAQSVTVENGTTANGLPVYSLDQIADYLTDGYWGGNDRSFDLGWDRTLDVDITDLTGQGKVLARAALQTWSDVTDITFREVSSFGSADITFDDNESGAFSSSTIWAGRILNSHVNVSTNWLASQGTSLTSYSFQTYIHEIGHALGLGHAGDYNGYATYNRDATYANDSFQASIMSYFSETENGYVDANFGNVLTPQIADILAVQNLYGDASGARSGNTTYGVGATADANVDVLGTNAVTIYDGGGLDTIDLSSSSANQRLDLNEETFSDLNGKTGNFAIARGTVIENASTGTGGDVIVGNGARNTLNSGSGNDTIYGGDQYDTIYAEKGDDVVDGGAGQDLINLGSGNDIFNDVAQTGKNGRDTVYGGAGDDTLNGAGGGDNLFGNDGNDIIYGGVENDKIYGGNDEDRLYGESGDDTIVGEAGDDFIDGGDGNDVIDGGSQYDTIYAGHGNDHVRGGGGRDIIYLQDGNDVFIDEGQGGSHGRDAVFGGNGADRFVSGGGNDRFYGGNGADVFEFSEGMDLDLLRNFEDGADTVYLSTDLTGGQQKSASQLFSDYGTTYQGSVALNFGSNDMIVFDGITNEADLYDDIFYLV